MRFRPKLTRAGAASLAGAVLAALAGWLLHEFRLGQGLSRASYDLLLVARGDQATRGAVMIYLEEKSYLNLQQPFNAAWDRALHARLVDRLTAAGARAIAFDIVFSDPNPQKPGSDDQFIQAVKRSGKVVLAADNVPSGPKSKRIVPPFDALLDSAAAMGSAEVIPDGDLVVREHTPEAQVPSLSWAAAELAGAPATRDARVRASKRWMNYYGPPNWIPWKSYADALDPALVPDDFFRDRVVFIGARLMTKYAGERKDEYRNPFSFFLTRGADEQQQAIFTAGVEIQATGCLNLLRGDWLRRLSPNVELWLLLVPGALFGALLTGFRPLAAAGVALAGMALVVATATLMFRLRLTWFPWLVGVAQIGVGAGWSVLYNSVRLYVQKRLYEHTLALYLSPKLVKKFSSNPKLLKPGAEKQVVTLFFSDIADFTSIAEGLDSDELAGLMNKYFQSAVAHCIHRTDGTVVKYIGDAIFAFWNAPEAQADHAYRACEAALRFRDQGVVVVHDRPLKTRIGLHTGIANVGNFGSDDRVDYTALGENVNLASRLEGLNKYLGTECLMSEATKGELGDQLVTRGLGSFQLKGFEGLVEVHELVGWPEAREKTRVWREAFAEALANFEQRNLEFATIGFNRVLELKPEDGPSRFYLGRIAEVAKEQPGSVWATHTMLSQK